MKTNERMRKVFSILLCLCMVLQYVPTTAFAVTTAEEGLCDHHTEHTAECGYVEAVAGADCTHTHDAACGYVEAVQEVLCGCTETDESGALVHTEGCGYVAPVTGADCTHTHDDACGYVQAVEAHECHYECAECAAALTADETTEPSTEATEPAPVCTCGTDDPATHATTCAVYVAPENPVCYCAEKCTEPNIWCDVCGFDHTACGGTDEAATYASLPDGCHKHISITVVGDATAQAEGGVYAELFVNLGGAFGYTAYSEINGDNREDMDDDGIIHVPYPDAYPSCAVLLYAIPVDGYSVTMTGAVENTYYDMHLQSAPTSITVTYTSALTGITVTTSPSKTSYVKGDTFDPAGMVITASYYNGTSKAVTDYNDYTVTDGDSLAAGQTSVTVSYTENGVTKTATVSITVEEKYDVIISDGIEHGTVTTDKETAVAGETVTLTVTPDAGYVVEAFSNIGTPISLSGGVYSFIMPAKDFTVSAIFTACTHETYEDGTCTGCGQYEKPRQTDDWYEIDNLGQLMWFAQNVNTAHKARLTADITIDNSVVWTPIGLIDGEVNSSTFDGGGHTITFANTNEGSTFGLFSKYNYSIIENLYLAGSFSCNNTENVGVLVNSAYRTTIRNVISTCDITNAAASGSVGGLAGLFGGQDYGGLYSLIENCAVYADVEGGGSAGGLIGYIWAGNQYCTVRNCAYVGNVAGSVNYGAIVGYNGNNSSTTSKFNNVYFCEADGIGWIGNTGSGPTSLTNVDAKTDGQFASGEVAYLLQGSQAEQIWGQDIGSDAAPGFTGGKVYYGYVSCAEAATMVYTNDSSASETKPRHLGTLSYIDNENGTHTGTYSCCGDTVTEDHAYDAATGLCVCNTQAVARVGDSYFTSFAAAAAAVTAENSTVTVFTDVTIGSEETVTFAAFATLEVAEGKTITCSGTVKIGERDGIIFENQLYYLGQLCASSRYIGINLDSADPNTYYPAGEGYAIYEGGGSLRLHNAVITTASSDSSDKIACIRYSGGDLTIHFSGNNQLTSGDAEDTTDGIRVYDGNLTLTAVGENAKLTAESGNSGGGIAGIAAGSLTVNGGTVTAIGSDGINAINGNTFGIQVEDKLTVNSGTVYAHGGSGAISIGVMALGDGTGTITVAEGAALYAAGGEGTLLSAGVLAGTVSENVNALGLTLSQTESAQKMDYTVYGDLVLTEDMTISNPYAGTEDAGNITVTFTVPEDTTLTVNEGVTLDLSGLDAENIRFTGTIVNNGTIVLPADFGWNEAPEVGNVTIDGTTLTWNGEKWVCPEGSHTGGTATCKEKAACETCGTAYGEVDLTNHDSSIDYVNGFCSSGHYEPAVLNDDGVYEIGNGGQLFWFAQLINNGMEEPVNAVLTANIDLENREWTAIGTEADSYSGHFNGRDHTVSGLRITAESQYLGLFGNIEGAGIRNLTVNGSVNVVTETGCISGLLVGWMTDSIVYNCYAGGSISVTCNGSAFRSASTGGLVGIANHSVIINSGSDATVDSNAASVGGLIGLMSAGYDGPVCLLNSYCTGSVTGSAFYLGGLVGYLQDDAVNNYFSGTVSSNATYTGMLFGCVSNSIEVNDSAMTFTPVIEKNYYVSDDSINSIGSTAIDEEVTAGYTETYSGNDDLLNKLNSNLGKVEEIISGHRGYLEASQWAQLVELLDGASVTAAHWRLNGAAVHCGGSGTFADLGNGNHGYKCSVCQTQISEPHAYNDSHICTGCGVTQTYTITVKTEGLTADIAKATYGQDCEVTLTSPEGTLIYNPYASYTDTGAIVEGETFENGVLTIPAAAVTGDMTISAKIQVWVTIYSNDATLKPGIVGDDLREGEVVSDEYMKWQWDYKGDTTAEDLAEFVSSAYARQGYKFAGLNSEADGTGIAYTTGTLPLEQHLTVYAQWEIETYSYQVETYTMDGYGEYKLTSTEEKSAVYGTAVDATPATVDEGFYLDTQHADSLLTATVSDNNDLVLKVFIGRNQYPITWDLNGGGTYYDELPQSMYYGTSQLDVWDGFTREGYTFSHLEDQFGNKYEDASPTSDHRRFRDVTMPIGGLTLKAIWTVNQYTITFDPDNGSEATTVTQDYGTAVTAPEAPTKDGYHFVKWDAVPATMPAEDLTVTAVWEAHTEDTDIGQTCKGYWCTACESWYGEADADAHAYENSTCTRCEYQCTHTQLRYEVSSAASATDFDKIRQTCSANCGHSADAWLSADLPIAIVTYTGEAHEPYTLNTTGNWIGDKPTVAYTDNVNAGTATVTASVASCSISENFRILKAAPKAEDFAVSVLKYSLGGGLEYNGSVHAVLISENSDITGMGDISVKTYLYGEAASVQNAGTYTVKITVTEGDNYTAVTEEMTVGTVTVAKLTPTAEHLTLNAPTDLTYNGREKAATVTVSYRSYLLVDLADLVTLKYYDAQGNLLKGAPVDAGTYTVKADVAAGDNYHAASDLELGSFTISPAEVTVESGIIARPKLYDGTTEAEFDCDSETVVIGFIPGDDVSVKAEGNFSDPNAGKDKTVTITRIYFDGSDAGNYVLAADGNQTTAKASIEKADPAYTKPTPKEGLTYTGVKQDLVTGGTSTDGEMQYFVGETASTDDSKWSGDIPSETVAGTNIVWWRVVGDANHSDIEPQSFTVTIAKKPIDATVTVQSKTYDGTTTATVTAAVDSADLVSGDSIAITGLTGTFSDANAGADKTVTIDSTHVSVTGTNANCYEITYPAAVTATIFKTTSSIAFNGYAPSKTYDGTALADPTAEQLIITGAKYEDVVFTWYKDLVAEVNKLPAAPSDAGTYLVTATVPESTNISTSIAVSGVFEIAKADATVTAPTANTLTYNGKTHELVTAGDTNGGTLQYSMDNSNWSEIIPTGTHAGTYTVWYKVVGDTNYNDVDAKSVEVTINPREVTDPSFDGLEAWYLHTGNAIEPTFKLMDGTAEISADEYTVDYSSNTDPGTATITVTDKDGGNYTVSGSATFEIKTHVHDWKYTASGNTITATCEGNIGDCPDTEQSITIKAQGKTYDGTAVTATLDGSIDGVDNPGIVYSDNTTPGTYTASITMGEGENAATASVEFTITIPEAVLSPAAPNGENGWYKRASLTAPAGYYISTIQDGTFGDGLDLPDGTHESFIYWLTYAENSACVPVSLTWTDSIKVDGTGPVITGTNVESVTDSTASITVAANDTLSGVASYALTCTDSSVTIGALADGAFPVSGMQPNTAYTFTLTAKDTAGNETATTVKLTTEKAASSVTKAPTAKELTYTGEAQALVTAGEANGGELQYSLDGTNYSASIPTGTDAETYTVYYKVVGDSNHNDTTPASLTVTIGKADPVIGTVTYSGKTLYNSTDISTVKLTRTDMTVGGTLVLTDSELTAGEKSYNWEFTPADTENYNTIIGTVKLNVTADVLENIAVSGTLDKSSYVYGDAFSIDGLTVTATYTSGATKDVTELVTFDSALVAGQTSVVLNYEGKTCEVSGITVAKKQIVIFGIGWEVPENPAYRGTAYTAVLMGTLPEGVEATLSGHIGTDAGSYTAKAVFSLAEGYSADNYEIVNGEDRVVEWSIGKKDITEAEVVLGDTLTYNGKEQTQAVTKVEIDGLTVTYDVTDNTGTDAGDYTLTITGNGNFTGTTTKTWSIAKKNITGATITLGTALTYNGVEQTQTVTEAKIDGLTVTYDVFGNTATDAGDYSLTVTANGNFEGTATADWSIAKAKLTITANNNSITYGDVPAANGVTGTGFVSNESIEDLSGELAYSYNYKQFGNVGTYAITPAGLTSDNYVITFADGTLTVTAKAITVTAEDKSKTYGDADPTLTYKVEGLVNNDKLTGNLTRAAGTDVGTYAITQGTLTAGNNYTITYTGANLTINAKPITAADVKLNGSLTYNGKEQIQPITVTEGITYEVSGNKATNVGTYELTVKGTDNYTGEVKLSWTIKETVAVVGTAPTAKDLTYTGKDQALVNAGTTTDGTMVYSLTEDGEYTESIPTGNAAGSYTVWYKVIGDDNHSDSEPTSVSVTVKKAAAAYNAPSANTLTFNSSAQALVTEGTTADGTMMYKLGEDGTYSETIPTAENAGTYTVYYYVKGDSNHNNSAAQKIDVAIGQLDITGKTVDITLAGSLTYNGAEQTMGVSSVKLDTLTVTYTVSGNNGTNADSYVLTVTGTGNFKGTATKEWNIAQKSVTVTAKDQTITYGETISGTEISAAGLVDGHSVTVTLAPSTANVTVNGTITASAAVITADGTDVTANYNVSYTSGKLVIEPDTSKIDALTTDNVTSANEEDIKAVQAMMASAETDGIDEATAAQWAAITATCEDLIEKIEAVETENARIADATADYDLNTVKSSDEAAIAALIADIDEQLATNNLTDEERSELEGLKTKCNNLIAKIDGTETLIAQLDKTVDDLDAETVKSTDKAALEQVIADAQTLIDSGNVTEAEKEALKQTQEDAQALIKVIDDTAAENKDLTDQAATFDEDTVKSTDKTELEQLAQDIEDLFDTQNLTEDERTALEAVLEQVEGMIDTINETAEDSKTATETIDALDPATVTSDDKDDLEQAIETIDALLKDDHLTEDERKTLEDAKADAEALIDVIEAAQDATDTENTEKVEDVTAKNVKPEDKEALEDAKADLEKALEDNAGNYTEEEKKAIQDEIQRIEDAIEALENVEDVTDAITQLPETMEPDDEEAAEKILDAKKAYDELTDHEKSLVDETTKNKLDDLVAALTAYDIIKGDGGKWTKCSSSGLSFTANGPFSKFVGIEVDGKEVDAKYYDAKAGSTIITLKQSFLKRLSTGEHTITVLYTDGETSGTFKILAASSTPATGDDFNIMLYGSMFTMSLAALAVLLITSKKRKQAN